MSRSGRIGRGVVIGVLSAFLAWPLPLWSAAVSGGTARGVRAVEFSLDSGKTWLALGATSMPVLDGAQIRSRNGGAILDFTDGSRLNILPFSSVQFRETGKATEVSLVHGRVTFQLPAQTRLELRTPTARLEPIRDQVMSGELFAGSDGTTGLRMSSGTLRMEELAGTKRTLTASLEPVFLPKRPPTPGPLFSAEAPSESPAAGAKAVFSPKGESFGFLQPTKQLVVRPGYTADLTQPFPRRTIQLAMAKVPDADREDATPLFDVNGGYVGYLAGPAFYPQAVGTAPQTPGGQMQMGQAVAQAVGSGAEESETTISPWIVGGSLLVLGGATAGGLCLAQVGICEGSDSGGGTRGGPPVATQLRPKRR
jgi:FecR protein